MITLVLVRHAKAEDPAPMQSDHQRALTLAGRTQAAALGHALATVGYRVDLAYVSDATRAAQTWKLMAVGLDGASHETLPGLYDAGASSVIDVVREAPASAVVLAIVAHEPTMSATALRLAGEGSNVDALEALASGMPTGHAAVLEFDGSWHDIGEGKARLVDVIGARRDG